MNGIRMLVRRAARELPEGESGSSELGTMASESHGAEAPAEEETDFVVEIDEHDLEDAEYILQSSESTRSLIELIEVDAQRHLLRISEPLKRFTAKFAIAAALATTRTLE